MKDSFAFCLFRNIQIDDDMAAGVDNLGFAALADAFKIVLIALMNVTVSHQTRLVAVKYVKKCLKASVREIVAVSQLICG